MRYPHRVTIQQTKNTKSATGVPADAPVAVAADIYAKVSVITGRERWLPESSAQTNDVTVIIRYRPGITTAMQVAHGADTYEITAVIPDERKRELRLVCKHYRR
ncbi:phage head closure protein [uncultured Amphritea sp.]|uniref:phage head closure protein n=1 Tax=uncultured Amphritea sp. TaxID=981605 RepID=UPI002612E496|nr:phage head closure protein [uncultured Amphritea sp.]